MCPICGFRRLRRASDDLTEQPRVGLEKRTAAHVPVQKCCAFCTQRSSISACRMLSCADGNYSGLNGISSNARSIP